MKKLLPLFVLLFAAGCEVLEEDISHKKVPVIAPADKVSTAAGNVDFRWSAVEYAVGYEFTVVSPSFAAAGRVVADTVIYADTLARRFGCRLKLGQGQYEWSVAGFNGGYRTRAEVRSLTVLPAPAPDCPDTTDTPDTPDTPDVLDVPDAPNTLDISHAPDAPDAPSTLNISHDPDVPDAPNTLDISRVPDVPDVPNALDISHVPDAPSTLNISRVPDAPESLDL